MNRLKLPGQGVPKNVSLIMMEFNVFKNSRLVLLKWTYTTLLGCLILFPHLIQAQNIGQMNIIGKGRIYYDFKPISALEASNISKNMGNEEAYKYFNKASRREKTSLVFGGIGILSGLTYVSTAGWNEPASNPQLSYTAAGVCLGSLILAGLIEERSNRLVQKGVMAYNAERMKHLPESPAAEPLRTHPDTSLIEDESVKIHTLTGSLAKGFVRFDGTLFSLEEAVDYARLYKMDEVAMLLQDLRMLMPGYNPWGLGFLTDIFYYRKFSKAQKAVIAFNLSQNIH
jgi:hypothetical protein